MADLRPRPRRLARRLGVGRGGARSSSARAPRDHRSTCPRSTLDDNVDDGPRGGRVRRRAGAPRRPERRRHVDHPDGRSWCRSGSRSSCTWPRSCRANGQALERSRRARHRPVEPDRRRGRGHGDRRRGRPPGGLLRRVHRRGRGRRVGPATCPEALAQFGTPMQLSEERDGSVPRAYVECLRDNAIVIERAARDAGGRPCASGAARSTRITARCSVAARESSPNAC